MLIQVGYDISVRVSSSVTIVFLLRVHPSRESTLLTSDQPQIEPPSAVEHYRDTFSNLCGRLTATAELVSWRCRAIVQDSGQPDVYVPHAKSLDVGMLPAETLVFLLPSRYCEVDSELMDFAWKH